MITTVPTNTNFGHTRITPLEGMRLAADAATSLNPNALNSERTLEAAYAAAKEMGLPLNREQFLNSALHITDFQDLCRNVAKVCMLRFGESSEWQIVRLWRTPLVQNQKSGVLTSDISDLDTKLMVDYASLRVEWHQGIGIGTQGSIRFGALESGQMTVIVLPESLQTPGIAGMDAALDNDPLSILALQHAAIERKKGWLPNNRIQQSDKSPADS